MNRERRRRLGKILDALETAEFQINELRDEEEAAIDNIPENLRGTNKERAMVTARDKFDTASCCIFDARELNLNELTR